MYKNFLRNNLFLLFTIFITTLSSLSIYSEKLEPKYKRTIYLNFRGATLTNGKWDPVANTAAMPIAKSHPKKAVFPFFSHPCKVDDDCNKGKCSIPMPEKSSHKYNPFNEKSFKRCSEPDPIFEQRIAYYVKKTLQDFNVHVVTERPNSGDYDMVIFNYNSTIGNSDGGSAGLVCNINRENMIIFVQDSTWGHGAKNLANIVTHEFGHTMGLAHSNFDGKSADPMHGGSFEAEDVRFEDRCVPVDFISYCSDYLSKFCKKGFQNTYQTVKYGLGESKIRLNLTFPEYEEGLVFTDTLGLESLEHRVRKCYNSKLKGVKWHSGMIIDRVRGVCDNKKETGDLGSDSGHGPNEFVCPGADNNIKSLEAWTKGYSNVIDRINITCDKGEKSGAVGGWDTKGSLEKKLECPNGKSAIGLRGNRGGWLNSISLVCK